METTKDETATCRGCGRELIGKPYQYGGPAYIRNKRGQLDSVPVCCYGGFVCSRGCDAQACRQQENSMPGGGGGALSGAAQASINRHWSTDND